ncbi:MAG: hypothetical protein H8E14_11920 [Candidatus Marinimicrobia bacterium]|nr:hypothetical protein [Candidatus Neomarinimicrobiota bacterium]
MIVLNPLSLEVGLDGEKMCEDRSGMDFDGVKVALAVRQVENSELLHECCDLEDEGVETVLAQYDVCESWSPAELEILKSRLWDLAFEKEVREAERWALKYSDPLILSIPNRPTPTPRLLELQHKTWKAEKEVAR